MSTLITGANKKPSRNLFRRFLGACAYLGAESVLPLFIFLVVEKFVDKLIKQMRQNVCSDYRYEGPEGIHQTHLLSVTRVGFAVTPIFYTFARFFQVS